MAWNRIANKKKIDSLNVLILIYKYNDIVNVKDIKIIKNKFNLMINKIYFIFLFEQKCKNKNVQKTVFLEGLFKIII